MDCILDNIETANGEKGLRCQSILYKAALIAFVFLIIWNPAKAQNTPTESHLSPNRNTLYKSLEDEYPNRQLAIHNIGKLSITVTNYGHFAAATGTYENPACEYPIHSDISYMQNGSLWIGGVVGNDTLVSLPSGGDYGDLFPDAGENGTIIRRSSLRTSPYYSNLAVSEQDFICTFADTFVTGYVDPVDNRPHQPMNVSVLQKSYYWNSEHLEDFIIFDYKITNIGNLPIKDMFLGFIGGDDVFHKSDHILRSETAVCGFRPIAYLPEGKCIEIEDINIAWMADNDGTPDDNFRFDYRSPVAVCGIRILRYPDSNLIYNYNWWGNGPSGYYSSSWGPRLAGTIDDPFRRFIAGNGYTQGDKEHYYMLSHPEHDYDQLFSAVSHTADGFMPPLDYDDALYFAGGSETQYMVSMGPFDLNPGDTVPFAMALIAGDNFHVDPRDFEDYFEPLNPMEFHRRLNFSDLALNARWAQAVFDTPGFDTDNDGYSGEFCWVYDWGFDGQSGDTIIIDSSRHYYTGDGAPDFRATSPPPPPIIRTSTDHNKVTLRWNGKETENAPDYFSGEKDFEGYRVYMARDNRISDFVLLASYDIDDYAVYEYDLFRHEWERIYMALTRDSLQAMFGIYFEPLNYYNEYVYFNVPGGKLWYFEPVDWNESEIDNPYKIHKVYPQASKYDTNDVTEEGWPRYYEYEYVVSDLQSSIGYYFSVTAFDYGAKYSNLGPLETSPLSNAVFEYALPSSDAVLEQGMEVMVYPNPYRIDGGYARAGYENRDRTRSAEWARRIHFANLPPVCTIRIYTVAGDLVRKIEHNYPDGGPSTQHEEWNVISKNTQAIVTGIYIWHVKSPLGEQMGKLVIIK